LGASAATLALIIAPGISDFSAPSLPSVSLPQTTVSAPGKKMPTAAVPKGYKLLDDDTKPTRKRISVQEKRAQEKAFADAKKEVNAAKKVAKSLFLVCAVVTSMSDVY